MPVPNDQTPFTIEDWLVTQIGALTGAGQTFAGVKNVEKATPPEGSVFPQIGVTFDKFVGDLVGGTAGGGVHQRDTTFTLVAAVLAEYSDATPDTTQQARLAVRQYVDDGNGNGLLPFLKANPLLGGYVQASWVTGLEVIPFKGRSQTAGTIAMAVVSLRARYRTR